MDLNLRFAVIVLAGTLLWFLSGLVWQNDSESNQKPSGKTESLLVKAAWFEAENYPITISARGYTLPNRQVSVRAEIDGRVEDVPAEKGSYVQQGEVICQIALEDRQQRVAEAEAVMKQAEIDYQGALKLKKGGYQSESAIAKAFASLESARANLRLRQLNLEHTHVTAPFSGFVDDRPVEVGDFLKSGDICAVVVEMNPLKITAALSERELVRVQLGSEVTAKLTTGERVTGKVTFLSQLAEASTRTYRMEMTAPNPGSSTRPGLKAGVSARVLITTKDVAAHHIPAALFSLDDRGELSVKALDSDNLVRSYPVTLVGDDPEGAWAIGLPEKVQLITVGHEYAGIGEQVRVNLSGAVTEQGK